MEQRKFYSFTNDYMFCYVLAKNPELAKRMIEIILGIEIERIECINAQQILNYSIDVKSVRFDVYLKDSEGTKFDVEMQTANKENLPKRMRYYQGVIASESVAKSQSYNDICDSYVIFICTYDPFAKGDAVYMFKTMSTKYPQDELEYDDGAYNVVVNATSDEVEISEALKNLLDYIENEKVVSGDLTEQLQNIVIEINNDNQWRHKRMTFEMKLAIERNEALAEGRAEGKAEGLVEGKIEGKLEMVPSIFKLFVSSGLSPEDAVKKIAEDYNLPIEKVESVITN